ncbi:MAG: acetyl-CoA acetyltransferase [Proteobacteria bacterium]|nr:acetyl-CoA acetyltransferase [Pseudomonadota bacterium]
MKETVRIKRPVIIGIGQYTHRPGDSPEMVHPLDLVAEAVTRASNDAGVKDLSRNIDTLCLVNMFSLPSDGLPGALSEKIDATPRNQEYTWIGACAPQWYVNRTAEKIRKGQTRLALICGGEALYSERLALEARGEKAKFVDISPKKPWMVGDLRDPLTALEMKYGVDIPIHLYPLFENALRRHEGLSIEQQRRELGEFCSANSRIAAGNPYAWFGQDRTAEEIVNSSDENRMISFPYMKFMCSIMHVDQSAALFMTDEETARQLGVPREKWTYLVGSGDASDIWHVTERADFHSSPSVRAAADMALDQADASLSEIGYFDFYSCFPAAPRMTRSMLGVSKDDPRPLTITGTMPYFGGPGNNYALHAICAMVEKLRQAPESLGMVQALSWYISKHSVGIYSGQARDLNTDTGLRSSLEAELDGIQGPELVEEANGRAEVETYATFHDHEGGPLGGVVVGRLGDRKRFLARIEADRNAMNAIVTEEFIGTSGTVEFRAGLNYFRP